MQLNSVALYLIFFLLPLKFEIDILLLNLDKRPEKLKICEYQLHKLGQKNYTRLPAIDGQLVFDKLTATPSASVNDVLGVDYLVAQRGTIKESNNKKMGCTLSHLKAMKYIIEKNITKPVLVLEDDFLADGEAFEKLEQIIPKLPENWGIFHAGHCFYKYGELVQKFGEYEIRRVDKALVSCTQAYVVNGAKYAKQYLDLGNTEMLDLADYILHRGEIPRYVIYPYLFGQVKSINSDINSESGVWYRLFNESLSENIDKLIQDGYFKS